jgi:HAD superfamily hydrolase (TIGR01509 family)
MTWELVIFDNDGVLVDSERLANGVLADLLTELGEPTTLEESVHRYMGGTLAGVRAAVEPERGTPLPADFEDRYHDALFAAFESDLAPVPGIGDVLDHLDRQHVSYCVASSGTHDRIRFALKTTGLLDRFPDDRIFSADDVAHGKPAPDLFLHTAARLGADPAGCVVVEDSPNGVRAAKAAGMTVVGYAAMTPAERLGDADVVVSDMRDLPAALGTD